MRTADWAVRRINTCFTAPGFRFNSRAVLPRPTRREEEIAALVAEGLTNAEIGERLFISRRTVEGHVEQIRNKLGFRSRSQIAAWVSDMDRGGRTATRKHNLPERLTPLVGREEVLAVLSALSRRTRLLTLTGAGGCGKSRLAIELAAQTLGSYPHGARLVELAAVSDPALVPNAAVAGLGVKETAGDAVLVSLMRWLSTRRLLLVLDNCEHLLPASAALAEVLLRAAPGLRILATSREPLRAEGEVVWRVPSLGVPEELDSSPADIRQHDAVMLFLERATSAQPDFVLDATNAATIGLLCRRLDGIPLAIELAAACLPALTLQDVLERLDYRFRLLTGGSRTALPRQRTLQATFDWSHGLLGDQEQMLFARLSVFAGSFSLEAAEDVCAATPLEGRDVAHLLRSLVDKSLLLINTKLAGRTRFRLLETVRQYAADRLAERDEVVATHDRHLHHFVLLAEGAAAGLVSREEGLWLERLEEDIDNTRVALRWSLRGREEQGLRLATALGLSRYWLRRRHYSEGRDALARLLAHYPKRDAMRANGLASLARILDTMGDEAAARESLQEAVDIARTVGDRFALMYSLRAVGLLLGRRGHHREAIPLFTEALELARELHGEREVAGLLNVVAFSFLCLRQLPAARYWLDQGLPLARRVGNPKLLVATIGTAAELAAAEGALDEAVRLSEEIAQLAPAVGDDEGFIISLMCMGHIAVLKGQPEVALLLAGAADALRQESGVPWASPTGSNEFDELVRVAGDSMPTELVTFRLMEGRRLSRDQAIALAFEEKRHLVVRSGERWA